MLPLFDMMLKAQNGAAMEAMAKQFNLAQEQAAQAMAALTPAFSAGLKRTAANPYDFTTLMNTMMSGAYAKYFEDMGKAFTPQGIADGNAVLERLFGSREVSRAIAAQAEQLTGVGQEILKKMMPIMADTLMGGLFKQATGQMQQSGDIYSSTPMGQMAKQWLDTLGLQPKPTAKSAAATDLFDNPFMQSLRNAWGLDKDKPASAPMGAGSFGDNPFAKAFQDMMTGLGGGGSLQPAAASSGTTGANPYAEALNSMFDSGLEVQKAYQKNMESIFDSYFRPSSLGGTPETPKGE